MLYFRYSKERIDKHGKQQNIRRIDDLWRVVIPKKSAEQSIREEDLPEIFTIQEEMTKTMVVFSVQ